MTTPTSNPVPSNQPQDLLFNAEKNDEFINGTSLTFFDRFGNERLTAKGIGAAADERIDDSMAVIDAVAPLAAQVAVDREVVAGQVVAAQNAQTAGLVSLPNAAGLSNLNFPDKTVAELADTGVHYVKSGASGVGSWTASSAPTAARLDAVFRPTNTSRSGWTDAVLDKAGRMLEGIHIATKTRHLRLKQTFWASVSMLGELALTQAREGSTRVNFVRASPRSGLLWAHMDVARRMFFYQRRDYTVWAGTRRLATMDDVNAVTPVAPTVQIYQAPDASGRQQVFTRSLATGVIKQLSSSGSNNTNPLLMADGTYVMYGTDRTTGLKARQICVLLAGGVERLVSSRRETQTAIGDSIQAALQPLYAAATGRTLTMVAFSGAASRSQAARVGAIPTTISVAGNVIAGNGAATTVTAISPKPLSTHNGTATGDTLTRTMDATINGVAVTLRRSPMSNGAGGWTDLYEVISIAGSADAACAAGSTLVPTMLDAANGLITIGLGENNGYEDTSETYSNITAITNWAAPRFPHIVVLGLIRANGLNSMLRAGLPKYYAVDSAGRDIYERFCAAGNGSPEDNADITAGKAPRSLLEADGIHPNAAGKAVELAFLQEVTAARGFDH